MAQMPASGGEANQEACFAKLSHDKGIRGAQRVVGLSAAKAPRYAL